MVANSQTLNKLIDNFTTTDIYRFPNDENSKREFYDTISNEQIEVFNKSKHPGLRGLICKTDFNVGSSIMELNTTAVVFYNDNSPIPSFIKEYENHLSSNFSTNKEILNLTVRCLLIYLEDSEFRNKFNNLCTHQKEIRLNHDMNSIVEILKQPIVTILSKFFKQYNITNSNVSYKSFKFINDIISILLMNYSSLYNYEESNIGIYLDPNFALINHSCMPNSFQLEENGKYLLINSLPMKVNDEITVTYVKLGLPKEIRKFQLNSRFFFNCQCQLCKLNYDPFFKLQCDKCGDKIKSSSLHGILATPNFIMKQDRCLKCNNQLNMDKYYKNLAIRNFFISMFFHGDQYMELNDELYFKAVSKELLRLVDTTAIKICIKNLSNSIDEFKIPENRVNLTQELMEQILNDKIFPLYTFPFNKIIFDLINNDDIIEKLKYQLRYQFLVNIPSDLSKQLIFDEYLYMDIAEMLHYLLNQNLTFIPIEYLCQCCYFLYKQVKSTYVEDQLVDVQRVHPDLPKVSPHESLKKLFKFANVNLIFESKNESYLIHNALGELVPIFYTSDSDDCL
ncbi:unnamed protein product [Candida verbasci]|uniref:SET domain-containing protein n=1 Tax=Candida verbasci TaxID=1227364 RepID=A0A9W4TRN9_9ASCO|nr:unnamed protein product [Candida verbasci]